MKTIALAACAALIATAAAAADGPGVRTTGAELDKALDRLFESGKLREIYQKWGIWNEGQEEFLPSGSFFEQDEKPGEGEEERVHFFGLLLEGSWMTVRLTFLSFFLAMLIGLPVAQASASLGLDLSSWRTITMSPSVVVPRLRSLSFAPSTIERKIGELIDCILIQFLCLLSVASPSRPSSFRNADMVLILSKLTGVKKVIWFPAAFA